MTRAALYFRQSLDRTGEADGIQRQRERCTQLAKDRKWDVVGEYADNDVSATKVRGSKTEWARLIKDAEANKFDVIIAVDMDRLLRQMADFLTLTNTGAQVCTVNGEIDLTTADGQFRGQILASVAEFETKRKSERQLRSNQQTRDKGLPSVGRRGFGYTKPSDGHLRVPLESKAVTDAFDMALEEKSLAAIAAMLNERNLTTTVGMPWDRSNVRGLLSNPRYAAKIAPPRQLKNDKDAKSKGVSGGSVHRNKIDELTDGNWEALVTFEKWQAVQTILRDPGRRLTTNLAQRLLSGIGTCALCGATLRSGGTGGGISKSTGTARSKVRTYRCSASPHLSRAAEPVEDYVAAESLEFLRVGGVGLLYVDQDDAKRVRAATRKLRTAEKNILELVREGLTTMASARTDLAKIRAEIAELESSATLNTRGEILGPIIGAGCTREAWDALGTESQRAIVATIANVTVASPGKGRRGRPVEESVTIDWKIPNVAERMHA
jgi:site-specific DNA recombinase